MDINEENKQILNAYRGILRTMKGNRSKDETKKIRKAFDVAVEAHRHMRRKSGEPYILHPLAVARICSDEIGLGPTSIICALLHDTVEDTELNLDDIGKLFNGNVRTIIDGLTKLSGVFDLTTSAQAENFRKMLLTIPEDIRVILIKLADRLHNMRTLGSMRDDKQLKIASETSFLYAPIAHRLGLNNIKTELEDLSFKYMNKESYDEIEKKLEKTKPIRERFIQKFCSPIKKSLAEQGINYTIKARTKAINSINRKINEKGVDFEEIFDVFAIRIIIDSKSKDEKAECWKAYSLVTDHYIPNPERLRDWISHPKQNGYESLHTTVMSPTGKWVEVQIRSKRMDEIAEKGLAAHWKYKEKNSSTSGFDQWINQVRDLIENKSSDALDFINEFKSNNLYSDEIFVFTPKGELYTLPQNATPLDFAFGIHTEIGAKCIGAKVNSKLVPLSNVLKSGDQVEILTSKNQNPKEGWLEFVVTSKARNKIRQSLKDEKKLIADDGKEILIRKLSSLKVEFDEKNLKELLLLYKLDEHTEMYVQIAKGKLDLKKIKEIIIKGGRLKFGSITKTIKSSFEALISKVSKSTEELLIGEGSDPKLDYKLSPCCNPLPGDNVFGFVTINDGIKIHRSNCPNAKQLRANYSYRIISAKWKADKLEYFIAGISFEGIDDVGLLNELTSIISEEEKVNMKSLNFNSDDGIFEGQIMLYVFDKYHLENLIEKLRNIESISQVERMEQSDIS